MTDNMVSNREAEQAVGIVLDYLKQFKNSPLEYSFEGSIIVSLKLHMINVLLKEMKKSYRKKVNKLEKEGKIVYINETEFYFK